MKSHKYIIRFWLPVVLYMTLIVYLSSLEFSEKPKVHVGEQSFKISDIMLHVIEYGLLGVLLFRAFHNTSKFTSHALMLALVSASIFGALDEVHQFFVPTRFFEVKDLVFNIVGSSSAYLAKKSRYCECNGNNENFLYRRILKDQCRRKEKEDMPFSSECSQVFPKR